jgi:sirohydrochlorin cobaltochelatase
MEKIPNVFIGNVEGYPELENVIPRLKKEGIEELILMPLMLVAGDHAQNDMAGEDEDSWVNVLKRENFKIETYLHGLGKNVKFQKLYINLIKDVL